MGVPLQEKWIVENRDKIKARLCLGMGALLDYWSCNKPRAPVFLRKLHLEWLWRIILEPNRMAKRYIIDGSKLFCYILKYKYILKCRA
jgi:exopolysaccharide biosynthesis WecB/TagA/CpsF family protein